MNRRTYRNHVERCSHRGLLRLPAQARGRAMARRKLGGVKSIGGRSRRQRLHSRYSPAIPRRRRTSSRAPTRTSDKRAFDNRCAGLLPFPKRLFQVAHVPRRSTSQHISSQEFSLAVINRLRRSARAKAESQNPFKLIEAATRTAARSAGPWQTRGRVLWFRLPELHLRTPHWQHVGDQLLKAAKSHRR